MVAELAHPLRDSIPDNSKVVKSPTLKIVPQPETTPFEKPLAQLEESCPQPPPPEPAPWISTAQEWTVWVGKRNAYQDFRDKQNKAEEYTLENDLRGVPYS